jgi:hypothetical protein
VMVRVYNYFTLVKEISIFQICTHDVPNVCGSPLELLFRVPWSVPCAIADDGALLRHVLSNTRCRLWATERTPIRSFSAMIAQIFVVFRWNLWFHGFEIFFSRLAMLFCTITLKQQRYPLLFYCRSSIPGKHIHFSYHVTLTKGL